MVHQQDLGLTTTQLLGLLKPSRSGQMHDWPMQNLINCMKLDNKVKVTAHTYTPVLTASTTNPDLGTGGEIEGKYLRIANTWILVFGRFEFGSAIDAGSGNYHFSLPVAGDSSFHEAAAFDIIGSFFWRNNDDVDDGRLGAVEIDSTSFDYVKFFYGIGSGDIIAAAQPVAQDEGDSLSFQALYKEAPL